MKLQRLEIGKTVVIANNGKSYTTYDGMATRLGAENWARGFTPENGTLAEIVAWEPPGTADDNGVVPKSVESIVLVKVAKYGEEVLIGASGLEELRYVRYPEVEASKEKHKYEEEEVEVAGYSKPMPYPEDAEPIEFVDIEAESAEVDIAHPVLEDGVFGKTTAVKTNRCKPKTREKHSSSCINIERVEDAERSSRHLSGVSYESDAASKKRIRKKISKIF